MLKKQNKYGGRLPRTGHPFILRIFESCIARPVVNHPGPIKHTYTPHIWAFSSDTIEFPKKLSNSPEEWKTFLILFESSTEYFKVTMKTYTLRLKMDLPNGKTKIPRRNVKEFWPLLIFPYCTIYQHARLGKSYFSKSRQTGHKTAHRNVKRLLNVRRTDVPHHLVPRASSG